MPMMFMTDPQPSGGFTWVQAPWGRVLRCDPLERLAPHFFTVGDLELRGDEREWAAVTGLLEVPRDRLRLVKQVHETDVAFARAGAAGAWSPPQADIVVSDDPTVAIGVRVADCAPILIADSQRRAVAAVHAGWRGTMRGAAGVAVRAMAETFGSAPEDLIAAIGPCLGPCCGEMGPEVPPMFRDAGHDEATVARWFRHGESGRSYFDLWRANREQLESAGVPASAIFSADICTKTHAGVFHSYRAQGAGTGRMLGAIRAR
jgi:YfiH family protein